uniref:PH domain-containing protein n=1 Tax=Steinernema glaseri TaxID=37863 RepID=A0A1I8ABJ5_9BILA
MAAIPSLVKRPTAAAEPSGTTKNDDDMPSPDCRQQDAEEATHATAEGACEARYNAITASSDEVLRRPCRRVLCAPKKGSSWKKFQTTLSAPNTGFCRAKYPIVRWEQEVHWWVYWGKKSTKSCGSYLLLMRNTERDRQNIMMRGWSRRDSRHGGFVEPLTKSARPVGMWTFICL